MTLNLFSPIQDKEIIYKMFSHFLWLKTRRQQLLHWLFIRKLCTNERLSVMKRDFKRMLIHACLLFWFLQTIYPRRNKHFPHRSTNPCLSCQISSISSEKKLDSIYDTSLFGFHNSFGSGLSKKSMGQAKPCSSICIG